MAISDIVSTKVVDFIDYALFLVVLLIIYYCVKFFIVSPPTKEEREAEREKNAQAIKGWFTERKEKSQQEAKRKKGEEKTSTEKRQRERLLEPALGFIVRAEQAAEKLRDDELLTKTAAAVSGAQHQALAIERNLKSSQRALRAARLTEKDPQILDFLTKLYETNQVALRYYQKQLENKIPDPADPNWDTKVVVIRGAATNILSIAGLLIQIIRKYMNENSMAITIPPGPP